MTCIDVFLALLLLAISLRLIFFNRGQAKFKRSFSVLAWCVINATAAVGFLLLFGRLTTTHWPPWVLLLLVVVVVIFAVSIYLHRGNISSLIKEIKGVLA